MSVSVVLADDDPRMLAELRRLLEDAGVVVKAAVADGRSALAAIVEHRPAAALIDLRMPEMNGLEVAEAISRRADPTPVILLSAFDDPHLQIEAVRVGVVQYLVKGCPARDILRTIDAAVRSMAGPDQGRRDRR